MNETTNLRHEPFCLPRVGEAEPRTERFIVVRYGPDGTTVVARPLVERCQECGSQSVQG